LGPTVLARVCQQSDHLAALPTLPNQWRSSPAHLHH
jgi:hypothetical protein